MNHVKTYPGEETSRVQNRAVVGPDCVILARFSFKKFGKGSCTVMHFARSRHDTVFQVQQLFRLLSGKVSGKWPTCCCRQWKTTSALKRAPSGFPLNTCGRLKLLSQSSPTWVTARSNIVMFLCSLKLHGPSHCFSVRRHSRLLFSYPSWQKRLLCECVCGAGVAKEGQKRLQAVQERKEESHGLVMRQWEKREKLNHDEK